MSYDYRQDVIGSAMRCDYCGTALTRGESCPTCLQKADAIAGTMQAFADKDTEIAALRTELAAMREERDALALTLVIHGGRQCDESAKRILSSRDADQRKAGALDALDLIANDTWDASTLIVRIQRGEVKP